MSDPNAVTPEDLAAASKLVPLFANRVLVQPGETHLRISFGESAGGLHSAIAVPIADALAFAQLIEKMATEQQRSKLAKALAAPPPHPAGGIAPRGLLRPNG